MFAELFGAVKIIDVDLAEFVKRWQGSFAVIPGVGKQLYVAAVQLKALLARIAFPRALLSKHKRVVKDAAADHDAVEPVFGG